MYRITLPGGNGLDRGQQAGHGLFIEIREAHPLRKVAELGSDGLDRPLVRSLGHDEHALCRRVQRQRKLQRLGVGNADS